MLDTKSEEMPLVVLEAIAMEIPVTTPRHREYLSEYQMEAGFIVPLRDISAMLESLQVLLNVPDLVLKGRRWVKWGGSE